MKKTNFFQFFAFLALLALVSCKGNPKDLIAKKWDLDISETKKNLMAEIEKVKKENPEMGKLMEEGMKNFDKQAAEMKMSVEFRKDGTAETNFAGTKEEGKWSISDDGKTLTMEEKSGKKSSIQILELTKSRLVFKVDEKDNKQTLAFVAAK